MGILDDAIRQHLELKRQHGADSDDVERLEKEAFGPPTRPGDPEFDTSEGEAAPRRPLPRVPLLPRPRRRSRARQSPSPLIPSTPTRHPPAETEPEAEAGDFGIFDAEADSTDEDWLASLEDVVEEPIAPDPVAESAGPESAEQAIPSESAAPETDDELTPTEQARLEHAGLGDTVAHPVVPEPSTEEPVEPGEPAMGESAAGPPEPPESAIFDHGDDDFSELDLELDLEVRGGER